MNNTTGIISLENADITQNNNIVLQNISFKINRGEFLYLIGNTGSGKSSLLRTLYAEIRNTSGKVKLDKFNIESIHKKQIPFLRRKIGIVFQDFKLLSDRNLEDNLIFVLKATGWQDKVKIKNRVKEVLQDVYLQGMEHKMPHELSGGEQQRAAIGRSLLNHPNIILADEPTGNLDPNKSEAIIQLLKNINTKGTTILIATHDYNIIKKFPARTLKCEEKNIIEIDSKDLRV